MSACDAVGVSPDGKGLQLFSTEPLRQMLKKAADNADLDEDMRREAAVLAKEEKLSWRRLKPIYSASIKARKEDTRQFKEVCKGTDIVRDPPALPVKSPELLARLQKLQKAEDERKYKEMVHDITGHERKAEALAEGGLVTYKDQMSYGLHVILVMAVFYVLGHFIGSRLSSKPGMKAAGGLIGLIIAMFLETTLLIIRSSGYSKITSKKQTRGSRKPLRATTDVQNVSLGELSNQCTPLERKKTR